MGGLGDPGGAAEEISRLLREHGPLSIAEVIERLPAGGAPDPEVKVLNDLEFSCPAGELIDERWVWLPTLLAGRVFTHRVTAEEVEHDVLTAFPDLDPITTLCEHDDYERLADGTPVSVVMLGFEDELLDERGIPDEVVPEGGVLLLPSGALGALGVTTGDLVGVRLTDEGLVLERVTEAGPGVTEGDRLVAAIGDDMRFLDMAVWTACVADPAAFTDPVLPLDEIIGERGLARYVDSVGPAGFDVERWRFGLDCERLALRYQVGPEQAVSLRAMIGLYRHMAELLSAPEDQEDPTYSGVQVTPEIGALLADPYLAALFRMETLEKDGSAAALGMFAETLEQQVPRRARVAYRWLLGVALEQLGEVESAERAFLAAESMDPEWALTLLDLARFASDRGDAERGLALLRRAEVDEDHPLLEMLGRHRATPRTDVGRNEVCWCGSGRKYKKCHLGKEGLPLDDRLQWLYFKACEHVMGTSWRELLDDVAAARSAYAADEDEADEMSADPLVIDAVLFEGGAFEDFVESRGFLLPADELALAGQWMLVERSVFEVEEVARGRSITVRDVRTGDVHEVREKAASGQLKPGELFCARVVPAGEGWVIFGGLERVALRYRDSLIELLDSEPDAEELVEFLTLPYAPPTMVNTEGHVLMQCDARLRVAPGVEALLDGAFDRMEDGEWCEKAEINGENRIRALLRLDGDTLTVSTNSAERMDETLATLTGLDPSIEVLEDIRQPADELAGGLPMEPAEMDPQLAAAVAEYIREYETKWLDESIPALDGATPREAADDPTRREDLIRLLDSFPEAEGAMSAARLRRALGLS